MSITISWYDPARTILLWVYRGRWTWQDHYAALERAYGMVTHWRSTIIVGDLRDSALLPNDVFQQDRKRMWRVPLPRAVFVIERSPAVRLLLRQIGHYVLPRYPSFYCVSSMEETLTRIEQIWQLERSVSAFPTISVDWYDETYLALLVRVAGHWSWQDVDRALTNQRTLRQNVNPGAAVILDLRLLSTTPEGSLTEFDRRIHLMRGLGRLVVVCRDDAQAQVAHWVARRSNLTDYQVVASMETAAALVSPRRSSGLL